jgi:hypothetical protein
MPMHAGYYCLVLAGQNQAKPRASTPKARGVLNTAAASTGARRAGAATGSLFFLPKTAGDSAVDGVGL